jgi:protein-S-isoprenylcysteine O-methyltransferase Ste14
MANPHRSALIVAWLGAAVFVVSLVWFIYSYIVRFNAVEVGGGGARPLAINVALFSIFAVHHSLLARSGIKRIVTTVVAPHLERSLYTWVASVLFIGVCAWWQPMPGVLYEVNGLGRVAFYAAQVAGIVLTVKASNALDVLDLAGVRPVQRAMRGTSVSGAAQHVPLETRGLYGFVRHPLYFAWALFVFTTPTMTLTRLTFAVISTGYLALAIPWEERSLVQTFGPAYDAYRTQVRWRMIPGIY